MLSATHFSFLLRMWQVSAGGDQDCHILLENIQTGEKNGFTSLEDLLVYLSRVISYENAARGERDKTEVQG